MVARNQELVSSAEALQEPEAWHAVRLSAGPPVTPTAGENQVPDAVHGPGMVGSLQRVWKEVIDVRHVVPGEAESVEAVETVTLLISAECGAGTGDRLSAATRVDREQQLDGRIVAYGQKAARNTEFPGGLDESPPGLGFRWQVWSLCGFEKARESVGDPNPPGGGSLVDEEPLLDLGLRYDMEGIDDIVEPEPDRGSSQLVAGQFSLIRLPARIQESAALECTLLVGVLQMRAKSVGEGDGQFLETDQLPTGGTYLQKRLPESELIGRDVPSEEDDPAPVILEGRLRGDEGLRQG